MTRVSDRRAPLWLRLAKQVRPYWRHLSGLLLLSLLAPPLALLTPLPLKIAVDSALGGHPLPRLMEPLIPPSVPRSGPTVLWIAVGLLLAVGLLGQLREFASSFLMSYTGERMLRDFRTDLFRHLQRLSLAYHDTRGTADSTYRIQYDATSIPNIAAEGIIPFVTSVLTLGSMIYVTARINLKLALVALAVSPALMLVSRFYRPRLRRQSRELKTLESSTLGVVNEALGAVRVVKAFNRERREEDRFVEGSLRSMRAKLRLALNEGGFGIVVSSLTAAGTAAALLIGTLEVRKGVLTLGELLLVMGYISQLYVPVKSLGKKVASLQSHLAGAERAFALLDEATDVPERPDARPLGRARGEVVFREVSFAYEQGRRVLRRLSFAVPAGTCVGIAGATGAGKTTLVNLLTRFYDPTEGQILLDGVDLRDYRLSDLRNQFAIVIQEPVLFSTSIAENIAYADPGATESEIVEAARAANADEFIRRLPQGYETLVGERGMRLSGGERQRVSLARAFLKNAPILILDEPTSSVDVETEATILEAMERLIRGRTTFIITHRASMLKHCLLVLGVERGSIVTYDAAGGSATPRRP